MRPTPTTQTVSPGQSWWLEQSTREDFQKAHAKEVVRLKLENKHAFWDNKVVGMRGGKI